MSNGVTPPEPRRGRPTVIDRDAIGEAAFRLWDEQGFAATTWRDISEASGVSIRTLTRHFNSQLDLVAMGVDAASDRLRNALADAPDGLTLDEFAKRLVLAAVTVDSASGNIPLIWQRVLTKEPLLRSAFTSASDGWTGLLAEAITTHSPTVSTPTSHAIAASLHAAAASAMLDWAMAGGAGRSTDAVAEALTWLSVRQPEPKA